MKMANAASSWPSSVSKGEFRVTDVRPRIQSLDILRGLVMIVMALDHVRDYFHAGAQHFDPTDLTQTTPILFFTRWITHLCAPAFMFLAGTSAYLQARRGKTTAEVAHFLIKRGLWLILLQVTWVLCLGWKMNFTYDEIPLEVIWALGVSMIVLSGLIFLPWRVTLLLSLAVVALHNALDYLVPAQFGPLGWLWKVLHVPDAIQVSKHVVIESFYPLIPWIAVMALGYCFGRVVDMTPDRRRRIMMSLGLALIAGFVLLRSVNWYGDMHPWTTQVNPLMTALSFLNCTKYPPSLSYLLMTLGPALLILGCLDGIQLKTSNPLIVFGRVPLFYYLVHLPLIHGLAILLGWIVYGRFDFLLNTPPSLSETSAGFPTDYGYNLAVVYVIWLAIVIMLYPACRWFAGLKQRNRSPILSYL
jgi:uncharacterized membrane protein